MGKKNNSYTASYKLKVISFAEQFGKRAAEREFGILESSVRYWRKQKEALRNRKSDSRAFRSPKTGKYSVLEDELLTHRSTNYQLNIYYVLIDYGLLNRQ